MTNMVAMPRICLSILLISTMWGSVLAVKDSTQLRKHEIGIYSGYLSLSSIDELYSFQKYSGGNIFTGLSYTSSKGKNTHQISTTFCYLQRTPDVPSTPSYVEFYESRYKRIYSTVYDINYSFLRKICNSNPGIYISANLLNHFNMSSDGNPEIYYTNIGVGVNIKYTFKGQNIGVATSFPVFSFVLRNNYHTSSAQNEKISGFDYVKENGRFSFPDKLFVVNAQVSYSYSLSRHFDLGIQYSFRYISDSEPRKLLSVSGLYSLGLTYKFR